MDSNEILDMMTDLKWDPTRLQPYLLGLAESALDGEGFIMDPAMPFPSLMQTNVLLTCAAVMRDEVLTVKQFPNMAKTEEDVYHHLSDAGFVNMFGTAGGAWFDIYLDKNEVINSAVQIGSTRTRKLTIPRHTSIKVNDTVFTMQYPINLIVKSHGDIEVVYDASSPSPLQTLKSNKVDVESVTLKAVTDGQVPVEFLWLRVYLKQMSLTTYSASLTAAAIFKETYRFTDNYLFTRAFYKRSDGAWQPMECTHSQQVFDASTPTLLLKVIGQQLTVELPYTYYANGLVTRNIRIDVYTTKGVINMALGDFEPKAFTATYEDLDNEDAGIYSAPLEVMSTVAIYSTDIASGGSAAPTFEVKRQRMLDNAMGDQVIPVSNAQLSTVLEGLGFNQSMYLDDLSIRTYLASKTMPDHESGLASTGVDTAVITMKTNMDTLAELETVYTNEDRYTVTPKTLYRNTDGILEIVSDKDRKALDLLSGEALVNAVTGKNLLFTPLHYVLDCTENRFVVRPYYLTNPTFELTSFADSNDTLGLSVSSSNVRSIRYTDTGYVVQIQTTSNDAWKALDDDQCHVQLAYMPQYESNYAYIKGVLLGKTTDGERIYQFTIGTVWDIDAEHKLTSRSFQMFDDTPRNFKVDLDVQFMMLWSVSDYTIAGQETSDVDQYLGKWQLPYFITGVYHENIRLKFGDELSGLWAMSRGVVGDRRAVVYSADVPALYPSNIYVEDPVTHRPVVETVNGKKQLKIKHGRGTQILDAQGKPKIAHYKGEAMMDEYGNVIYENDRYVMRWWDVCLFDAVYRYSTDSKDKAYIQTIPSILAEWINDTLGPVRKDSVLDRTVIYFQPLNTLKHIDVLVEDGKERTIYAPQDVRVDIYVSKQVYSDAPLRASLKAATIALVVEAFTKMEVTRAGIQSAIKAMGGDDIITVAFSGLGGDENDFNVVTILNESSRLAVAKALSLRPDETISVEDAIQVNFVRHSS